MTVVTFDVAGLGDRSYLISDGTKAVVIDPQRDPQDYVHEAEKLGVAISDVFETHIHNDYVSGGLALARATGASYRVPAGEPVSFAGEACFLLGGESFAAGLLEITAIETIGHTNHHLAYLIGPAEGATGEVPVDRVVCTGGSLLTHTTGRTDLLGPALAEELARSQWRSVRHLLQSLPSNTRILPTHGFGSFCSAAPTNDELVAVQTIAEELRQNPAALLGEEEFVSVTLANLPPIPAYYRHMAPLNRAGPAAPTFGPVTMLDGAGLEAAVSAGRSVVDLRHRRVFAAEHLPGTLNLELGDNLTTYLGWIVPWDAELVLLAEDESEIARARRLLACMGREELWAGALWHGSEPGSHAQAAVSKARRNSYPVASFGDLLVAWSERGPGATKVFDVRHPHEWRAGHVAGRA